MLYLCPVINQLIYYVMDIETVVLKAIMERYGSLSTLKQAMYEDTDTVLVNLCIDIDDKFTEDEILIYIRKILG